MVSLIQRSAILSLTASLHVIPALHWLIVTYQAADLARAAVDKVANVAHVPLFLYGAAASHKDRYLLSTLRKGEYEGLEARLTGNESSHQKTTRMPDAGTSEWTEVVSKSGGITIGARDRHGIAGRVGIGCLATGALVRLARSTGSALLVSSSWRGPGFLTASMW